MDSATVLQAADSTGEAIPPTLPSGTEQLDVSPPVEASHHDEEKHPSVMADGNGQPIDSSTSADDAAAVEHKPATPADEDSATTTPGDASGSHVDTAGASDPPEVASELGDAEHEPLADGDEPAPEPATKETDEAAGRDAGAADALKSQGNSNFVAGRLEDALALYEEAVEHAPLRPEQAPMLAILHANRAACLLGLERYEECIAACDDCLDLNPKYVKAMLRRVKALEKLDMLEEAQQDYEDILEEFPGNIPAKQGLERLQASQKEKEEKLKTEMLDKLKGVGNSLLGHFGLTLDNFKVDQDAKTGGYSINFQQGADAAAAEASGADGSSPAAST